MADVSKLIKALKDTAVAQYGKGAPYREALASALKGDMSGVNQALSKSELTPADFAGFVGGIKGVGGKIPKTQFEMAHDLAQERAALPVSEGGLGLPAINTAMDRAKAMGFDTEKQWLHGTRNDFGEFSKTKDIGYHFGDKWQANDRAGSGNTSNVIPAYLKNNNIISTDDVYGSSSTFPIYGNLRDKGHISQDEIDNIFQNVIRADHDKALNNLLKSKNYGGIEYDNMVEGIRSDLRSNGTKNTARIVLDPSQIRSPNAAFDPFRRNEADILAGVGVLPFVDYTKKK